MFKTRIFTLYPELFPGPFNVGLFGKALKEKIWELETINIRDYANDKHKSVDDTPYGGGSGMLMRPDVLSNAIENNTKKLETIIYLTPRGKLFNHKIAKDLSNKKVINLICGHFEGVDERVLEKKNIQEISIGDFVLSGGETAAYAVLDATLRYIPGILGNKNSIEDESFENGLLEYPQFTKPQIWQEMEVPEVLLSGDHAKIKDWRLSKSEDITRDRRPDLWKKYKRN